MSRKTPWIATVLLESRNRYGKMDNSHREKALLDIIQKTAQETTGNGVILLPAGFFNTGRRRPTKEIYAAWIKALQKSLKKLPRRDLVICFGIDGRMGNYPNHIPKDQLVLSIDKNNILALGRKFYPTTVEKNDIELAKDHDSLEDGRLRYFSLNGKRFYLAVCYDIFGIKHKAVVNPDVDYILNPIHKFTPRCECEGETCECQATSGDVYFAKNGFAGASRQWQCPVFGSVVFCHREVPEKWPSGVSWDVRLKNLRTWKYSDNRVKASQGLSLKIPEGNALIRVYDLTSQN